MQINLEENKSYLSSASYIHDLPMYSFVFGVFVLLRHSLTLQLRRASNIQFCFSLVALRCVPLNPDVS